MDKMREAFEKWAKEKGGYPTRLGDDGQYSDADTYHAWIGYQAAIAAVREGGPVAQFNWNRGEFEWLTPYKYELHHMKPLYKLPEDMP